MADLSIWIDESEKGPLLAVGGIVAPWDDVPGVVRLWRHVVKKRFGLEPQAEVKWNLPSGHDTREALERNGHTTRELCEAATRFISYQRVTCIVAVMFEERRYDWWKQIWSKASVRDFYCEGLRYVLQRVAEEAHEQSATSCVVICDTPELGKKEFASGSIRRGPRAVEQTYAEWYRTGVGVGPGKQNYKGGLSDIGFHPSILAGDATYHDMLQMADVVVGATRDWVDCVRAGKLDPWVMERIRALTRRFRRRHGNPDFFGDGLLLWPWKNELWMRLQASLR